MKNFIQKNYNVIYIVVVVIAIIISAVYLFWPHTAVSDLSFGTCLTERGLSMYGADTCSSCQYQKSLFGNDFENVDYVNCQFNVSKCNANSIEKYPTWLVAGQRLVGAQSLEALSEMSGCEL